MNIYRNAVESPLFSFAVITDSHINQDEMQCNSPFEVNRLANRRLRHVIGDLNQRDLVAVFHLGDVVHPVPSMGDLYSESAERFFEVINDLRHPLHLIPGNHDVGDKKIDWGPAGTVRPQFLRTWNTHFGADRFHVDYQNVHFIGINAQLVGSGLDEEAEQVNWVERVCDGLRGERLFLLSHYPPFLENPEEIEHYDNLSPAGRRWMLDLLKRYRFEGLFAGHVHHFWYNRFEQCDCYLLPATSFVRQDYSEMFRISPAPELGRNDPAKLGYFVVQVHARGHDFEMIRSFGRESTRDAGSGGSGDGVNLAIHPNPRTSRSCRFGFDLRQDWMERVPIPASGGLDEFDRKWVRNDYGLLALWEMGIRHLRIPLQDVLVQQRRERIAAMHHLGFRFHAYQFGTGSQDALAPSSLLESIEICWPGLRLGELDHHWIETAAKHGLAVRVSPLHSRAETMDTGRKYFHVINHGLVDGTESLGRLLESAPGLADLITGWCFRSGLDESPAELIRHVGEVDRENGICSVIHLRMAPDNPAETRDDEVAAQSRLAEAFFAAWVVKGPIVFCDGLVDMDRGYFPRPGVLDRLYNPKPAWSLIRKLQSDLHRLDDLPGELELTSARSALAGYTHDISISLELDQQGDLDNGGQSNLVPRIDIQSSIARR